jgi:hypothetical protein
LFGGRRNQRAFSGTPEFTARLPISRDTSSLVR